MAEENKPAQKSRIVPRVIEDEMKQSYMDYSMSVIVGRALPDIRDGLKPVHRRILYAMHEMGLAHNKPFKKSARIVGDVLGKYHPHGDLAVYDALVRLAQDFSMRYPLVDGQGNWGCFTADTKIKLTDGRNLSFRELVEEYKQGKKNYTYTITSEGLVEIAEIKHPRLTKKDQKIMKVVLDNGEEIRCTPDHKFMLRDGSYTEAQKLKPGDSLMPIYTKLSAKEDASKAALAGYLMILQPTTNEWVGAHVLADEWNIRSGVYNRNAGKIRHHVDFNKLNNDPENILRLPWAEHWRSHARHASDLHKKPEYRKKISEGRKKFWSDSKNKETLSKRTSDQNRKNWQKPEYRQRMSQNLSKINVEYVKAHPAVREKSRERLMELWSNPGYKEKMSQLKSNEMKTRWEKHDASLRRFTPEESKEIWSRPGHRELVSRYSKELWKDSSYKKKMREEASARWKDDAYLAKFPKDHFSAMAKKLWENPNTRELHRLKAILQWQDQEFRKKVIAGVRAKSKQRLLNNPEFMKPLAQKAQISLHNKWQDPAYKDAVIKSKILGYVNSLADRHEIVTPEIYEKEKSNNCIPLLKNALRYFDNFSDMVEQAKSYNHKVLKIEMLPYTEDAYDFTIEGTHNFSLAAGIFVHNSIDGDNAAAQRYTEARLKKPAEEMLQDLEKETVDFVPNYDQSLKEPSVLPGKAPNLLINGSSGIAVGMATNIPPHNIREVCRAAVHLIDHPEATNADIMLDLPAPDFPTGGIIMGTSGIREAYETGRGKITVRARTTIEDFRNRQRIIVNEIPYMVNKAQLIEEIAELVKDRKVQGISDLRDESDRDGMRIVIELKQGTNPDIVQNQLYQHSRMQTTFGIIMLSLVGNEPKVLQLREMLSYFLLHRQNVVQRRTAFDLKEAEQKAHILEGLLIALQNIDPIVAFLKKSKDPAEAKQGLVQGYKLTETQAQAILEMRLSRLTGLEQDKIRNEHSGLLKLITELKAILSDPQKILDIIKKELTKLGEDYGDERRTQIIHSEATAVEEEHLIPKAEMIVTLTRAGYVKRLPVGTYQAQRRGGKGVIAAETKEEDLVEDLFVANTHDNLLIFTSLGKVHWLKVYQVPEAGRYAKGTAIVNLLQLDQGEKVTTCIPVSEFREDQHLFLATKNGTVKKTPLSEFSNPRRGGIIAVTLAEGDQLMAVLLTDGKKDIIIATKEGNAIRFNEADVRPMGRTAQGVIGIRLREKDEVIDAVLVEPEKTLLTITELGYGKRTAFEDYGTIRRGGMGVINIKVTEKNGGAAAIKAVKEDDEMIVITQSGIAIRIPASQISVIGRNTQGVRVIKLEPEDRVTGVATVQEKENGNA